MTSGTSGSEQNRTRMGLVFLVVGVVLVMWAWGSWIYRASVPAETAGTLAEHVAAANPAVVRAARLSPLVLLVGLLLVLVVLFGSYTLIRAIRRHRALADRKRPPPTPADDAWAMNKLRNPPDDEEL